MARAIITCSYCRRERTLAIRTGRGAYCNYCYQHHLVEHRCIRCGRRARAERDETRPICPLCRRADWRANARCATCDKPPKKIYACLPDGGVLCQHCYVRPVHTCGYCGKQTRRCQKSRPSGIDRWACRLCFQQRYYRLARCRRCKRVRASVRDSEERLCADCTAGKPRPRHTCRYCNGLTLGRVCWRCSGRSAIPKHTARLAKAITQLWLRQLFLQYADTLSDRVKAPRCVPVYLRRDVAFFVMLDRHFEARQALTNVSLARWLGAEGLTRFRRASSFLVTHGVIGPLACDEVEWAFHDFRAARQRTSLDADWARQAYDAYHCHMRDRIALLKANGIRRTCEPMQVKSVTSALTAACHLLNHAACRGAQSVQEISQRDLDQVSLTKGVKANRLANFVTYLNTSGKRFSRLKAPRPRSYPGLPEGVLGHAAYVALEDRLLAPAATRCDLRGSLIALLALKFAQPVHRVLAMRRSQIRQAQDQWQVRFTKLWLPLPIEVAQLLTTWLGSRTEICVVEADHTSPFLFPGHRAMTHYSSDSFGAWLLSLGVKPQQLLPSAIVHLVQHPAFHPRVAIDGLGLTRTCVAKYMDAYASPQLAKVRRLAERSHRRSERAS